MRFVLCVTGGHMRRRLRAHVLRVVRWDLTATVRRVLCVTGGRMRRRLRAHVTLMLTVSRICVPNAVPLDTRLAFRVHGRLYAKSWLGVVIGVVTLRVDTF